MLDDFDSIFKDKENELEVVLNANTIDSFKTENVKRLLFAIESYQNSIMRIKDRFLNFKKSADYKLISNSGKELVKNFEDKIIRYLNRSNNFIDKCEEFLYPIGNNCDLL